MRSMLFFENERAEGELRGPVNSFLIEPEPVTVDFVVHRDKEARAAVIEIQNHKILLKEGQWGSWVKVDFELSMPMLMPNKHISGIVRFYLQEVGPNFRLYTSPINTDPSGSALVVTLRRLHPSGTQRARQIDYRHLIGSLARKPMEEEHD